ncbi:MAG: dCTP deaminase, partial [Oscillospiraceae bacterium]|nr:dCTP deaminase [Oscillospiraceae bacterium]
MILTDKEIRDYVGADIPLIENFKEESLQSESYDLSLGKVVSRLDSKFKILRLDQQETIDNLYLREKVPDSGY